MLDSRKGCSGCLLPLAIAGGAIALGLLFCLGGWLFRPGLLPPTPAGPVAESPSGRWSAQVIRHESYSSTLDDPDNYLFRWVLVVTGPGGTHECEIAGDILTGATLNRDKLAGKRAISYTPTWDGDRAIVCDSPDFWRERWQTSLPSTILLYDKPYALFLGTSLVLGRPWTPVDAAPQPLTEPLKQRLRRAGRPEEEIAGLTYVRLEGEYHGARCKDFISLKPDVLLVIGPHFGTHGAVVSYGPALAIGECHFMGALASYSWIFLDDDPSRSGIFVDERITAAQQVYVTKQPVSPLVGWPAPPVVVPAGSAASQPSASLPAVRQRRPATDRRTYMPMPAPAGE